MSTMTATAEPLTRSTRDTPRSNARAVTRPIGGLWLWVRSRWRTRWRALLGIVLVVAIAGGITLAAVAGARRADTAFDRFLATIRAPISLTANANGLVTAGGGFSDEFVREVAALPGVRGVMPGTWLGVALQSDGEPLYFFSMGLGTTSGDDPPAAASPRRGRLPDPAAIDEVAINEAAAATIDADLGDTIELRSYGADQMDAFLRGDNSADHGPRIEVRVVGVVRASSDIGDSAEPMALLSAGFAEHHRDDIASCRCGMFVNAATRDLPGVIAAIEGITNERDVYVRTEDTQSVALVEDAIGIEVGTLWITAAIAAAVGLFVIVLAIGRHVGAEDPQHRSLQTLGATRWAIVRAWTLVFIPVAVIGSIGAVIIAIASSPLFPRGLARVAEPDLGLHIDAPVLLVGAALIASGVVAMSTGVAWSAMKSTNSSSGTSHPRHRRLRSMSLPPTMRLGINLALDRTRDRRLVAFGSAVTGMTIAIAGVLVIGLIERSTTEVLATPAAYGSDWNYSITQPPQDPDALTTATMELSIEALAFQSTAPGMSFVDSDRSDPTSFTMYAFDPLVGSIGPLIDEGRPVGREDDVVITARAADRLGVDIGDELVFEPSGQVFRLSGLGRTNDNEADSAAIVTIDGLQRLLPQGQPQLIAAHVRTGDVDDATIGRLHEIGWTETMPPARVGNLDQIGSVPRLLGIGLSVLGFAGLLNALLAVLGRRGLDLAITRALGFTPRQTLAAVVWQGLVTVAVAMVIGVPLGVLVGRLIWKQVVDSVGAVDLVTIPWPAVVAVPLAALVLVAILGSAVGHRAGRLHPADVLRRE